MADFERIDAAVRYHLSQKSNITGLWGIYIGATFTGAAFTVTDIELSVLSLILVTIGFWAFALGHAGMLYLAIENCISIDHYIKENIESVRLHMPVASEIAKNRHVPSWSFGCHAVIDFCVTALIWRHDLLVCIYPQLPH